MRVAVAPHVRFGFIRFGFIRFKLVQTRSSLSLCGLRRSLRPPPLAASPSLALSTCASSLSSTSTTSRRPAAPSKRCVLTVLFTEVHEEVLTVLARRDRPLPLPLFSRSLSRLFSSLQINLIFAVGYVEKRSYVQVSKDMPRMNGAEIEAEYKRLGLADAEENLA